MNNLQNNELHRNPKLIRNGNQNDANKTRLREQSEKGLLLLTVFLDLTTVIGVQYFDPEISLLLH